MTLIQCKLGPTQQTVGGANYSFERDQYGRAVSIVLNAKHKKCFLALEHYEAVPERPVIVAEATEPENPSPDPEPLDPARQPDETPTQEPQEPANEGGQPTALEMTAQQAAQPGLGAFAAFDHDGDGKPGGSKPKAPATRKAPAKKK